MPSDAAVSVDYATTAGSATPGVDFTTTSGRLTIPAGRREGVIDVPILGDTQAEPDETFTVTLSAPSSGAVIEAGRGSATGWIVNDDAGGVFTDDPLVPQQTEVKAQHFVELRQYIDSLRAQRGLGGYAWSGGLAVGQEVLAAHLTELRAALAAVYVAAGRPLPVYEDATIVPGVTVIKAVHITQLRAAVVALW